MNSFLFIISMRRSLIVVIGAFQYFFFNILKECSEKRTKLLIKDLESCKETKNDNDRNQEW